MSSARLQSGFAQWAGLFGGAAAWYAAHDLSFYLVRVNCGTWPWLATTIHALALLLVVICGLVSFRAAPANVFTLRGFSAWTGVGAAALFALVIIWQGLGTLIYSGCER
jgi:hypothetical protein